MGGRKVQDSVDPRCLDPALDPRLREELGCDILETGSSGAAEGGGDAGAADRFTEVGTDLHLHLFSMTRRERQDLILDLDTALRGLPDYIRRRPVHRELLTTAARLFLDPQSEAVLEFERAVNGLVDEAFDNADRDVSRRTEIARGRGGWDGLKVVRDLKRRIEKMPDSDVPAFASFIRGSGLYNDVALEAGRLMGDSPWITREADPDAVFRLEKRVKLLEKYERLLKEYTALLLKTPDRDELIYSSHFQRIKKADPARIERLMAVLDILTIGNPGDASLPSPQHTTVHPVDDAAYMAGARDTRFKRIAADPAGARHPETFEELETRSQDYEYMLKESGFPEFVAALEREEAVASVVQGMTDPDLLARQRIVGLEKVLNSYSRLMGRLHMTDEGRDPEFTLGELAELHRALRHNAEDVFGELAIPQGTVIIGLQPDPAMAVQGRAFNSPSDEIGAAFREFVSKLFGGGSEPGPEVPDIDYTRERDAFLTQLEAILGVHVHDEAAGIDPATRIALSESDTEALRGLVERLARTEALRTGRLIEGETEGLSVAGRERFEAAVRLAAEITDGGGATAASVAKGRIDQTAITDLITGSPEALHRAQSMLSVQNLEGYAGLLRTFTPGEEGERLVTSEGSYYALTNMFRAEAERLRRELLEAPVPYGDGGHTEEWLFLRRNAEAALNQILATYEERDIPDSGAATPHEISYADRLRDRETITALALHENMLLRSVLLRERNRLINLGATDEEIAVFDSRIEKIYLLGGASPIGQQGAPAIEQLSELASLTRNAFDVLEFKIAVREMRTLFTHTELLEKLNQAAEVFGFAQFDEENFRTAVATLDRVLALLDSDTDAEAGQKRARELYAAFVRSDFHIKLIRCLEKAEKTDIIERLTITVAIGVLVVLSAGMLSELAPAALAGFLGRSVPLVVRVRNLFIAGTAFDQATRAVRHVLLNEPYFRADDPLGMLIEAGQGAFDMTLMLGMIGLGAGASVRILNLLGRGFPTLALGLRHPLSLTLETIAMLGHHITVGYGLMAANQGYFSLGQFGANARLALQPISVLETGIFLIELKGAKFLASPEATLGQAVRIRISDYHAARLERLGTEMGRIAQRQAAIMGEMQRGLKEGDPVGAVAGLERELHGTYKSLRSLQEARIRIIAAQPILDQNVNGMPAVTDVEIAKRDTARAQQEMLRVGIEKEEAVVKQLRTAEELAGIDVRRSRLITEYETEDTAEGRRVGILEELAGLQAEQTGLLQGEQARVAEALHNARGTTDADRARREILTRQREALQASVRYGEQVEWALRIAAAEVRGQNAAESPAGTAGGFVAVPVLATAAEPVTAPATAPAPATAAAPTAVPRFWAGLLRFARSEEGSLDLKRVRDLADGLLHLFSGRRGNERGSVEGVDDSAILNDVGRVMSGARQFAGRVVDALGNGSDATGEPAGRRLSSTARERFDPDVVDMLDEIVGDLQSHPTLRASLHNALERGPEGAMEALEILADAPDMTVMLPESKQPSGPNRFHARQLTRPHRQDPRYWDLVGRLATEAKQEAGFGDPRLEEIDRLAERALDGAEKERPVETVPPPDVAAPETATPDTAVPETPSGKIIRIARNTPPATSVTPVSAEYSYSVDGGAVSLVGVVEGLTPELERDFRKGYKVERTERNGVITYRFTRHAKGLIGATMYQRVARPGDPEHDLLARQYEIYEAWRRQGGFERIAEEAEARENFDRLKALLGPLGIRLVNSTDDRAEAEFVPAYGAQYGQIADLVEMCPEALLRSGAVTAVVIGGGRSGAARGSAFEDGRVILYREIFGVSRRFFQHIVLHEFGHAILDGLDGKTKRHLFEQLSIITNAHAVIVVETPFESTSKRASYVSSLSEFLAEMNTLYIMAGDYLRSKIEGIRDPAARRAYQEIYNFYRDLHGGKEFGAALRPAAPRASEASRGAQGTADTASARPAPAETGSGRPTIRYASPPPPVSRPRGTARMPLMSILPLPLLAMGGDGDLGLAALWLGAAVAAGAYQWGRSRAGGGTAAAERPRLPGRWDWIFVDTNRHIGLADILGIRQLTPIADSREEREDLELAIRVTGEERSGDGTATYDVDIFCEKERIGSARIGVDRDGKYRTLESDLFLDDHTQLSSRDGTEKDTVIEGVRGVVDAWVREHRAEAETPAAGEKGRVLIIFNEEGTNGETEEIDAALRKAGINTTAADFISSLQVDGLEIRTVTFTECEDGTINVEVKYTAPGHTDAAGFRLKLYPIVSGVTNPAASSNFHVDPALQEPGLGTRIDLNMRRLLAKLGYTDLTTAGGMGDVFDLTQGPEGPESPPPSGRPGSGVGTAVGVAVAGLQAADAALRLAQGAAIPDLFRTAIEGVVTAQMNPGAIGLAIGAAMALGIAWGVGRLDGQEEIELREGPERDASFTLRSTDTARAPTIISAGHERVEIGSDEASGHTGNATYRKIPGVDLDHFVIIKGERGWFIKEESNGGTYVNGRRLVSKARCDLLPGDRIRAGDDAEWIFELEGVVSDPEAVARRDGQLQIAAIVLQPVGGGKPVTVRREVAARPDNPKATELGGDPGTRFFISGVQDRAAVLEDTGGTWSIKPIDDSVAVDGTNVPATAPKMIQNGSRVKIGGREFIAYIAYRQVEEAKVVTGIIEVPVAPAQDAPAGPPVPATGEPNVVIDPALLGAAPRASEASRGVAEPVGLVLSTEPDARLTADVAEALELNAPRVRGRFAAALPDGDTLASLSPNGVVAGLAVLVRSVQGRLDAAGIDLSNGFTPDVVAKLSDPANSELLEDAVAVMRLETVAGANGIMFEGKVPEALDGALSDVLAVGRSTHLFRRRPLRPFDSAQGRPAQGAAEATPAAAPSAADATAGAHPKPAGAPAVLARLCAAHPELDAHIRRQTGATAAGVTPIEDVTDTDLPVVLIRVLASLRTFAFQSEFTFEERARAIDALAAFAGIAAELALPITADPGFNDATRAAEILRAVQADIWPALVAAQLADDPAFEKSLRMRRHERGEDETGTLRPPSLEEWLDVLIERMGNFATTVQADLLDLTDGSPERALLEAAVAAFHETERYVGPIFNDRQRRSTNIIEDALRAGPDPDGGQPPPAPPAPPAPPVEPPAGAPPPAGGGIGGDEPPQGPAGHGAILARLAAEGTHLHNLADTRARAINVEVGLGALGGDEFLELMYGLLIYDIGEPLRVNEEDAAALEAAVEFMGLVEAFNRETGGDLITRIDDWRERVEDRSTAAKATDIGPQDVVATWGRLRTLAAEMARADAEAAIADGAAAQQALLDETFSAAEPGAPAEVVGAPAEPPAVPAHIVIHGRVRAASALEVALERQLTNPERQRAADGRWDLPWRRLVGVMGGALGNLVNPFTADAEDTEFAASAEGQATRAAIEELVILIEHLEACGHRLLGEPNLARQYDTANEFLGRPNRSGNPRLPEVDTGAMLAGRSRFRPGEKLDILRTLSGTRAFTERLAAEGREPTDLEFALAVADEMQNVAAALSGYAELVERDRDGAGEGYVLMWTDPRTAGGVPGLVRRAEATDRALDDSAKKGLNPVELATREHMRSGRGAKRGVIRDARSAIDLATGARPAGVAAFNAAVIGGDIQLIEAGGVFYARQDYEQTRPNIRPLHVYVDPEWGLIVAVARPEDVRPEIAGSSSHAVLEIASPINTAQQGRLGMHEMAATDPIPDILIPQLRGAFQSNIAPSRFTQQLSEAVTAALSGGLKNIGDVREAIGERVNRAEFIVSDPSAEIHPDAQIAADKLVGRRYIPPLSDRRIIHDPGPPQEPKTPPVPPPAGPSPAGPPSAKTGAAHTPRQPRQRLGVEIRRTLLANLLATAPTDAREAALRARIEDMELSKGDAPTDAQLAFIACDLLAQYDMVFLVLLGEGEPDWGAVFVEGSPIAGDRQIAHIGAILDIFNRLRHEKLDPLALARPLFEEAVDESGLPFEWNQSDREASLRRLDGVMNHHLISRPPVALVHSTDEVQSPRKHRDHLGLLSSAMAAAGGEAVFDPQLGGLRLGADGNADPAAWNEFLYTLFMFAAARLNREDMTDPAGDRFNWGAVTWEAFFLASALVRAEEETGADIPRTPVRDLVRDAARYPLPPPDRASPLNPARLMGSVTQILRDAGVERSEGQTQLPTQPALLGEMLLAAYRIAERIADATRADPRRPLRDCVSDETIQLARRFREIAEEAARGGLNILLYTPTMRHAYILIVRVANLPPRTPPAAGPQSPGPPPAAPIPIHPISGDSAGTAGGVDTGVGPQRKDSTAIFADLHKAMYKVGELAMLSEFFGRAERDPFSPVPPDGVITAEQVRGILLEMIRHVAERVRQEGGGDTVGDEIDTLTYGTCHLARVIVRAVEDLRMGVPPITDPAFRLVTLASYHPLPIPVEGARLDNGRIGDMMGRLREFRRRAGMTDMERDLLVTAPTLQRALAETIIMFTLILVRPEPGQPAEPRSRWSAEERQSARELVEIINDAAKGGIHILRLMPDLDAAYHKIDQASRVEDPTPPDNGGEGPAPQGGPADPNPPTILLPAPPANDQNGPPAAEVVPLAAAAGIGPDEAVITAGTLPPTTDDILPAGPRETEIRLNDERLEGDLSALSETLSTVTGRRVDAKDVISDLGVEGTRLERVSFKRFEEGEVEIRLLYSADGYEWVARGSIILDLGDTRVFKHGFEVHEGLRENGIGSRVAVSHLRLLQKLGYTDVEIYVGQEGGTFWPALGYDWIDGDAREQQLLRFTEYLRERGIGGDDIARIEGIRYSWELLQFTVSRGGETYEVGREFLEGSGTHPWEARFDLRDGSESWKQLERRLADLAARHKT